MSNKDTTESEKSDKSDKSRKHKLLIVTCSRLVINLIY